MSKSEVYSWRLTPELKAELEAAARVEKTTISKILVASTKSWLDDRKWKYSTPADQARRKAAWKAMMEEVDRDRTPGPPTPSATNANIRKAFMDGFAAKDRARKRVRRAG